MNRVAAAIRHRGSWRAGQISIRWVPDSRPIIPEVEALIDTAWQRALSRPGVLLFDGPMCRLESIDVSADAMRLTLSRSSYKPFLGTNMSHPELADRFGPEILANPVGLSALIYSGDGQIVLGRRQPTVAYYPSAVHPFAGALEPRDDLDVFDDIRRELREELSLDESSLQSIECIGLVEDRTLRQPELIFAARTSRSVWEIEASLDRQEHLGVFAVSNDKNAITTALQEKHFFTPVALAALELAT